jgi:hypothetical protein
MRIHHRILLFFRQVIERLRPVILLLSIHNLPYYLYITPSHFVLSDRLALLRFGKIKNPGMRDPCQIIRRNTQGMLRDPAAAVYNRPIAQTTIHEGGYLRIDQGYAPNL